MDISNSKIDCCEDENNGGANSHETVGAHADLDGKDCMRITKLWFTFLIATLSDRP